MIQLECPWLYTSQQKQYILTGKWLQVTYCTTVVHCYQMKFLKCRGITLYLLFVIPCAMKRSSHLGLYSILSRDIPFSLNCGQLGLAIQGTEKTWLWYCISLWEAWRLPVTTIQSFLCCTAVPPHSLLHYGHGSDTTFIQISRVVLHIQAIKDTCHQFMKPENVNSWTSPAAANC